MNKNKQFIFFMSYKSAIWNVDKFNYGLDGSGMIVHF